MNSRLQRIWQTLHPRNITDALASIDQEAATARKQVNPKQETRRVWIVLMLACVCLLMVHYLKYSSVLYELIRLLEVWFSIENHQWLRGFQAHPYRELLGFMWWGALHLLCFIIIPMVCIKFILKQNLSQYGWQWGSVHKHWLAYVLLMSPILLFAVLASFRDDFSSHYPFYKLAGRSWFDLIAWQIIYISQFIAVEFFFRGFIVNGLRIPFGSLSIAVMCLPYLMLHFPKLWLESTGAIAFGFLLGILALRSKSIWGGVLVHVGIALMMDISAMLQGRGLPSVW
jgi:membrane protease YdiL (CAAX protease family)